MGVDTGGTFTDGYVYSPDGEISRWKVLSTGCLRGQLVERIAEGMFRFQHHWGVSQDLFSNYFFRIATSFEEYAKIIFCDPEKKIIQVDIDFHLPQPLDFEITAHEEAPVLICRLATSTLVGQSFPPMVLRLGTTRGTNALLEGKGAKTTLFVTQGFKDLLAIGTQQRPNLFQLDIPSRRVLAERIIEVPERINYLGKVLTPLTISEDQFKVAPEHSVAISLMHSHKNPDHELTLKDCLKSANLKYISSAHEVAPFTGYLAKTETTLVNAYLSPVIEYYLSGIRPHLAGNEFLMMNSSGNLEAESRFQPKNSFLSGPAGGCMASAKWAMLHAQAEVITFDMGGTSTDTARYAGQFTVKKQLQLDGMDVLSAALDIHTVAAGGGSIIKHQFGQILVGPDSAGAYPGPSCYGLDGPLTITDINLLLGKIFQDSFKIPLHVEAARRALTYFIDDMGQSSKIHTSPHDILLGVEQLANEKMADAIRKISIGRGFDPATHTLLVFGGAGGLHACKIAELLNMSKVSLPYEAGIWSAKGMATAQKTIWLIKELLELWSHCGSKLEQVFNQLFLEAQSILANDQKVQILEKRVLARLKGQDTSLNVLWSGSHNFFDTFINEYTTIYGYTPAQPIIEIEGVQLLAGTCEETQIKEIKSPKNYHPQPIAFTSPAYLPEIKYPVYQWELLQAGAELTGPAVVVNDYGTSFIETGWTFVLTTDNTLMGYHSARSLHKTGETESVLSTSLFLNRFTAIAEDMGAQLERSATSVNIKERKDFSCALLDHQGYLLVNAPHIPVHLGSLGVCCRLSTRVLPLSKGDVLITNHPAFGGSHLPDLTLIAPVFDEFGDMLIGYVANRAHHAEIGGKTPGSMPVDAHSLPEEGVIVRPTYLVKNGVAQWDELEVLFTSGSYPTRSWSENKNDLIAALASLQRGKKDLQDLATRCGVDHLLYYMAKIRTFTANALDTLIKEYLGQTFQATEYLDDGYRITVKITVETTGITIDLSDTSGVHPLNLNANTAIVHSAILYFLRIWVNAPVPLNEGLLDRVEIILPESLLNPKFNDDDALNPAVVGGNTEVSQRLIDTLLKAIRASACSQGTMNNFLFGDETFGYYETIGGGSGATSRQPGRSGCHQHMTNTKITDPEILELRYPVILERFSLRPFSGGQGVHTGGDGLIRRVRFLKPLKVTFLGQHRLIRPYGLLGGGPGAPGSQWLETSQGRQELPGAAQITVGSGDVLQIETPGGGGWGSEVSRS